MANLKYKNKNDEWKSILSTRGPKGDNADITINGSNLKEASFYAPVSSGLIGQALISKGANQSPQWTNLAVVAGTNSYNDLDNKPTIPTTTEELISGSTSVLTSGGAYDAFAQRGIPSGGSVGQIIKKASATDYDFSWADACIDNLTSTSIITPLSANQGRILNEKFSIKGSYTIYTNELDPQTWSNTDEWKTFSYTTLKSSGGIKIFKTAEEGIFTINSGIKRIRISARITYDMNISTTSYVFMRLIINNNPIVKSIEQIARWGTLSLDWIGDINENDTIQIQILKNASGTMNFYNYYSNFQAGNTSQMIVEVLE